LDRPLAVGEFLLYEEIDNGFITIRFDNILNGYLMHMDCKKWSLSTYKRYKKIWNVILKNLKAVGINKFYGTCTSNRALKFNSMFNVKYTGKEVVLENGEKAYLTVMEI
tara:strand:- start:139 stop:465 length:327 start_codon:yes stop_codon:yes gene_type:complete